MVIPIWRSPSRPALFRPMPRSRVTQESEGNSRSALSAVQYGMGARIACASSRSTGGIRPGAVTAAQEDLSGVLAMVAGGGRPRHVAGLAAHGIRMAGPCRPDGQSAILVQFPCSSQRCRDAPVGVLSCHRARDWVCPRFTMPCWLKALPTKSQNVVAATQAAMAEASRACS